MEKNEKMRNLVVGDGLVEGIDENRIVPKITDLFRYCSLPQFSITQSELCVYLGFIQSYYIIRPPLRPPLHFQRPRPRPRRRRHPVLPRLLPHLALCRRPSPSAPFPPHVSLHVPRRH
ncbi:hypothetical protein Syun_009701 [Stephania yunnanensis]|uniref:Uncharacterized protein n=1 Tax=Stephania yunnanensis TaxID=152371 RepID=A0AAP0KF48_9MAGN